MSAIGRKETFGSFFVLELNNKSKENDRPIKLGKYITLFKY